MKFKLTVYTGDLCLKSYRVLFTDVREYSSSRYAWMAVSKIAKRFDIEKYGNIGRIVKML